MTESPHSRSLTEGVSRLNSLYSEQLKDSEIVLREIPGKPRFRLMIEPVTPSDHEHDFQKDLGETFDEDGMQAFIAGLEAAPLIEKQAESSTEGGL